MTREERTKLIKHLKYNRSIGADYLITDKDADEIIKALEQEPTPKKILDIPDNATNRDVKSEKCIWIKYDYRTICHKECGGENPYWRIPENMENLKYCPYCGREIEAHE